MQYVESPLNPLYLQGRETVDKSIQETLNLTLKVVDNLLKTPSYAQVCACYPQVKQKASPKGGLKLGLLLLAAYLKGDGSYGVAV